jgi:arylsulfatase A-like enzyme
MLLLAISFGTLTGLADVALAAHHRFFVDQPTLVGRHVVWMAPLGMTVFFLLVALVLLVASLLSARLARLPLGILVFSSLATLSIVLGLPWVIHPLGAGILALGIGSRLYAVSGRDPDRMRRRLAKSTVLALAAIVVLNAVVLASGSLGDRRVAAGSALPARGPNVLLIILDTVRAKSLSLYGRDRLTTPELDQFAERGLVFESAIAPAPWTLPTHASIFTGRHPQDLSADWAHPLDSEYRTLAEVMSEAGYATAGFAANLLYVSRAHGLARGFEHYEDFPVSPGQVVLSTALGREIARSSLVRRITGPEDLLNRKRTPAITRRFLRWLDTRPREPFFAFLNLFDAHEPYLPPAPFDTLFGPTRPRELDRQGGLGLSDRAARGRKWESTPGQTAIDLAAYEASIAAMDAALGHLFAELDARALLDSTVVIITADHGEQQGEHELYGHLNSLYASLLRVPLVIVGPGVPQGRTDRITSLTDIASTVLDLTDIDAELPGRSFADWPMARTDSVPAFSFLSKGLSLRSWYPVGRGPEMYSLWWDGHHYICNGDGSEEVFDSRADQREERDLAGLDAAQPVLERSRAELSRVLGRPARCP